MTYMISSVTSSRENASYNEGRYPSFLTSIGQFLFCGRRVTAATRVPPQSTNPHLPAPADNNGALAGFNDLFYGMRPETTFSMALTGFIATGSRNLPSFREVRRVIRTAPSFRQICRMGSTPPSFRDICTPPSFRNICTPSRPDNQGRPLNHSGGALAVPALGPRGMLIRCGSAGYHLLGKKAYAGYQFLGGTADYFSVHLWHGVMSTGRGRHYGAISRPRAEAKSNLLALSDAVTQLSAVNQDRLGLRTKGILREICATLEVLNHERGATQEKRKTRSAYNPKTNLLARLKSQFERQFGKAPQSGAAADVLKTLRQLLDAGVELSPRSHRASALAAQLVQDAVTINRAAKIIGNPGLDGSTVDKQISDLLDKRERSSIQILRQYGFVSFSHAGRCIRAFDYFMTALANPRHKVNYALKDVTKKPLDQGGREDIVNAITTLSENKELEIQAGWGRALQLDFLIIGYFAGAAHRYVGGTPFVRVSQAYDYQLKFSRDKDGIKVSLARIGKAGPSAGGNFWFGGKISKLFNLELILGARISKENSNEDALSFTIADTDPGLKDTINSIMTGRVEDFYNLIANRSDLTSKSEKKNTVVLNASLGIMYQHAHTAKFTDPDHDRQYFVTPMAVGLNADVIGYQKSKVNTYKSKSGEYIYSEDSQLFTSYPNVTAGPSGMLRWRQDGDIGVAGDLHDAQQGLIASTSAGLMSTISGERQPVQKWFGEGRIHRANDADGTVNHSMARAPKRITGTALGPFQSTASVQGGSDSRWARFIALLEKLLKGMRSSDIRGDYGRPTITRDGAGHIKTLAVDVTVPRNGKILQHPQIETWLDRLHPTQRKEARAELVDKISFTTKENRDDIKRHLGDLRRLSQPTLNATIDELEALADFTSEDGLIWGGDRQKFRETVNEILSLSSDKRVEQIADKLLMLTDNQDTKLWPARGNGTKITISLEASSKMIRRITPDTPIGKIAALTRRSDFGIVKKATVKETRAETTSLTATVPLVSASSYAKVMLTNKDEKEMPKLLPEPMPAV